MKSKLLFALSLSAFALSACKTIPPTWNGKIWAGASGDGSIRREQAGERIACTDAAFDQYLCMSNDDFNSFYATYILGCSKWKKNVVPMSRVELLERAREAVRALESQAGQGDVW